MRAGRTEDVQRVEGCPYHLLPGIFEEFLSFAPLEVKASKDSHLSSTDR